MKIVVGNLQKSTLLKILAYSSFLLDQQGISHDKVLYQLMDEKKRIYRCSSNEKMGNPIYILNPFQGPYTIQFQDQSLTLTCVVLDPKHLYPYLEKDVFEKVFRLEIEGQEQEILDHYIRESVYYYNQFNSEPTKAIYVYQYVDINEQWEKFNEVRKRSIHTIYLPLEQSQKVLADVRHFLLPETRSNYEKFGIPYRKTYCFYGPPGSGKTSLIHSVASEMDKNICTFRFHNSTKDLDLCNALKWIPKNSIFVLEDIDCIIKNREEIKSGVTFSGILNLLDGLSSMDCMLTFITTNHFLELDAAIKRPGRIDYILEFSYINREQIFKMLDIFYPEEKEDFEEIYKEIKGYKMTVTHLQKFLFSLYPQGKVKKNINKFIQEYLKYYEVNESKLYI